MTDETSSSNAFEQDKPGTDARNRAEAAIEDLRKRGGIFVDAVRATRMAMALTDPSLPGNPIVFANQSFLDLSGYSMEEVLGQEPYFMNGAGTDPEDADRFRRILESDRDGVVETVQYAKNGRRFVATVMLSAFKDDSGKTLHHFLSWADVTRRVDAEDDAAALRKTQAALRQSETRYRILFNSLDEGFCVIELLFDGDGQAVDYVFLETNASFERQTGLSDAVGKRMRELAPGHEQHWFDIYGTIALTGEPQRFEQPARALGRWYDVYAFPIDAPELRRVGILFRDVLERKRTEQELARSNQLLRTTVDNSLQIIQLFKAVRDDQGAITDFEWLLTNKQWNDRWGSNVGKRLLTENPGVRESGVWDKFLQVMETGVPITHEHFYDYEQFDGWFFQTIAKANDGILVSTLDITDRKRAELALRESEEKYRSLFETMGQGYAEIELLRDDAGRAVDQLYVEFNPAFERLIGIRVSEARGRKASEVLPDLEPWWHETFDRIAKRGEPERIEHRVASLAKWYEVYAYPSGGDRLIVLYEDITQRKHADQALRASEERKAFLLALGDTLRLQPSASGKIEVAARDLGQRLAASRVLYAEFDSARGVADIFNGWLADGAEPFPAVLPLEDYEGPIMDDLQAGRTVRIDDVGPLVHQPAYAGLAAIGVQALLSVPLVVSDKLVANLSVHQHEARHWTDDEVALVQEVAERLWAEVVRARAEAKLSESEARFRQFAETSSDVIWIRSADSLLYEYVSPAFETVYGGDLDELLSQNDLKRWAEFIHPEDRDRVLANLERIKQGERITHEFRIRREPDGEVRWIRDTDFPLLDESGRVQRVAGIGQDITEQRRIEDVLRDREERLRLIVENARDYAIFTLDENGFVSDWYDGAEAVFGWSREEIVGRDGRILYTPEDRTAGVPEDEMRTARDEGKAPDVRWHLCKDGSLVFIEGLVTPLHQDGHVGFLKIGRDATERHRSDQALRDSERHQRVLLAELQHRVRNTLAVVRSIARRTADRSDDVGEMIAHLDGRLNAFSRVQSAVTRNPAAGVDLESLVEDELLAVAAREGDQLRIEGPSVHLKPRAAESISLAIHELATNAVKYGALATARGQIVVKWRRTGADGSERLELDWEESGLDGLEAPPREGFGHEMLRRSLPYDLQADTEIEFRPQGLRFSMSMLLGAGILAERREE